MTLKMNILLIALALSTTALWPSALNKSDAAPIPQRPETNNQSTPNTQGNKGCNLMTEEQFKLMPGYQKVLDNIHAKFGPWKQVIRHFSLTPIEG